MTDTTTEAPKANSGSLDAVAESMIMSAEPEPKKRPAKTRKRADAPEARPSTATARPAPGGERVEPVSTEAGSEISVDDVVADDADTLLDDYATDEVDQEKSDDQTSEEVLEAEGDTGADDEFADEGEEDDGDPSRLADATMVSVTVDGEAKEVSLADLKKRYSGEGAIEKRLQEATELKKTVVQQVEYNRNKMAEVMSAVGKELFKATIPPPNPELARSNPGEFLAHQNAYQQEQQMLQQRMTSVQQIMAENDQIVDKQRTEMRSEEAAKLQKALPVLAHPVKGPKVKAAILKAAKDYYGFSDVDISAAQDHRIFVMAADAMRWRKMKNNAKLVPSTPNPRTMRQSGSTATPASGAVKQERKAMAKAQKTGTLDDVAATMVVKPKRGRKR